MKYKARLTQGGTADPIASDVISDLPDPIVWSRGGAGEFFGELVGAFTGATVVLTGSYSTDSINSTDATYLVGSKYDSDKISLVQTKWIVDEAVTIDGFTCVIDIETVEP